MIPKVFEEILQNIHNGKTAIFCGAGISYSSGVPLVYEIKSAILERLKLNPDDYQSIFEFKSPFELFMETTLSHSGEYGLFDLFELGRPNTNHYFIAELCRLGLLKYVLTTNFDNHIETALDELHVSYKLLYREDDFQLLASDVQTIYIIKLHGSVHDRDNIAITIHKVAERQLIAMRKKIIETVLNLMDLEALIFLGYSFSDLFDITPNLQKCLRPELRIYNIDHQLDYNFPPQIDSVREIKDGQVFDDAVPGANLRCNTDYLIKVLWDDLIKDPYHFMTRVAQDFEQIIEKWYLKALQVNPIVNSYLAGHLCNMVAANEKALSYFNHGLSHIDALEVTQDELKIDFLYSVGMTYRELQKGKQGLQNSLRFLYKGLKISRRNKFQKHSMVLNQSIGIALADKKIYEEAIFYYEDAKRTAVQIGDPEVEGKCLGNIGIAIKNIAKDFFSRNSAMLYCALSFQRRSLAIAEQLGDKRSEGRVWGNMGILYSELAKKEEMFSCYHLAYKISEELNDVLHQGIWAYNLGFDYVGIDNKKALEYVLTARAIFETKGWENHVMECDDTISKLSV